MLLGMGVSAVIDIIQIYKERRYYLWLYKKKKLSML